MNSNASLVNLDGLSNITSVGGSLEVENNIILTDFCGLYSLLNSGGLTGTYTITGNASNPTEQEIIDSGPCAALPVELTSFVARRLGDKIELEWQTATEVNNYGFNIERSAVDSQQSSTESWEKIGFVIGNGNSNSPKNYSFVDDNPLTGKAEYRLKQIDNDGAYKYSKVVTINSLPTHFELSQNYPNPFNPRTVINYQLATSGQVTLKVYDILGREVTTLVKEMEGAGNHKVEFDASNFTSGIYFYIIQAGNYIDAKKLILLK